MFKHEAEIELYFDDLKCDIEFFVKIELQIEFKKC